MRIWRFPIVAVVTLLTLCHAPRSRAAEWQWSAEVTSVVSTETNAHPRAFLWIPPDCRRVRAVIVGQHNMLEEGVLEHPAVRKALADVGMAAVWVSPAFDGNFRFDQGAGEHFENMMAALAKESGYSELRFAPAVPIGHSAMASYPYHFAAWNPGRTLAAISIKGTWPDFRYEQSPPWRDEDLSGVPLLFVNGEYEDANGRAAKAASFRARVPKSPLTMLADEGAGHFDFHDRVCEYIGLYLRTVAKYRLPAEASLDAPVQLKSIDPTATGWVYDRWRLNKPVTAPPAPVGQYAGNPKEAFWAFDEALARATVGYDAGQHGKKADLLGYLQDGQLVPQNPKTHQQVTLKFLPVEDGLTFKLTGMFLDTVPEGRPVTWTGLPAGSPIGHATDGGPISIDRICGPVIKASPDTFKIRFYRMGLDNPKRTNDIWLMATHPGDAQYKRAVQQSELRFPYRNTKGAEQHITFPPVADRPAGTRSLKLNATSDADVPVYYYVREGPAEVSDDGTLTFTAVPPRSRMPIKVTVVAWQWGRSIEPLIRTAQPVERTFSITAGGQ
jgi:hypothetical protein